ncbi:MAG: hypothetical protein IIZ06_07495 [Kiritimatiellae bacterium]|nr:hypothetical protein [Kiritimatiellia bacterium]
MWDFIDNAGIGVHDPTATTCVDLSGNGNTLTINPNGTYSWSWADDGINLPSSNYGADFAKCLSVDGYDARCVETVFTLRGDSARLAYAWSFGVKALWLCRDFKPRMLVGMVNTSTTCRSAGPYLFGDTSSAATTCLSISQDWEGGNVDTAVSCNGSQEDGKQYQDYWTKYSDDGFHIGYTLNNLWPLFGKYHNIRIYNRNLTAAEKAHNLAIDMARFPLTEITAVPVEYIAYNGGAAIPTGYSITTGDMSVDAVISDVNTTAGERDLMCANSRFSIYITTSEIGCWSDGGSATRSNSMQSGVPCNIVGTRANGQISLTVDGATTTSSSTASTAAQEVLLLAYRPSSSATAFSYHFAGKVYSIDVYESGSKVMAITPFRLGTTGILYDSVRARYLYDINGGSYSIGPDKTS